MPRALALCVRFEINWHSSLSCFKQSCVCVCWSFLERDRLEGIALMECRGTEKCWGVDYENRQYCDLGIFFLVSVRIFCVIETWARSMWVMKVRF